MSQINTALAFDDVLLVPQFSDIASRAEVDTSTSFAHLGVIKTPIIASPMDTVCEGVMCSTLNDMGAMGTIHRYCTIDKQVEMYLQGSQNGNNVICALGVGGDYFERAQALTEVGCIGLCIDVAHGDHVKVAAAIREIRRRLVPCVHIMAGNVATLEGFNNLAEAGANSIRVGVGGGSICSTRLQTGHGVPTFQSVQWCAKSDHDVLIIADGGIRNSGDIVKALGAGADAVMIGSLLAGTEQSPGDALWQDGVKAWKTYRGMASVDAQMAWRGSYSSNEGVSRKIRYKGCVRPIIEELTRGIRSGLSYSGARSISEFQARSIFIRQTSAGQSESATHIDRIRVE